MKTVSEHVLDIVENSVRANATMIEVIVEEDYDSDIYELCINDNGCGMNQEMVQRATNPFFTTRSTRKVGLGLSLLKHNALASGGTFSIDSGPGEGTRVKAVFKHSHLDRPPAGDIWDSLNLILLSYPDIHVVYRHKTNDGVFELDSLELKQMLDGLSLQQGRLKKAIAELIKNNLEEIKASK